MKLTVEELYKGNSTEINDKLFLSTKELVEPFLKAMKDLTESIDIDAWYPAQLVRNKDVNVITYNKVIIECYLKSKTEGELREVVGLAYNLEAKIPVYKIYRGYRWKDGTFTTINRDWLVTGQIEQEVGVPILGLKELLEKTSTLPVIQTKLETLVSKESVDNALGKWVTICMNTSYEVDDLYKVKLPYRHVINAYKLLTQDENSDYYITGDTTYVYNVYRAMLDIITNDVKDVFNTFEKTILINEMLNL